MNEQWQAQWIWCKGAESPRNEWHCFRRSFVLDGKVERATVRLTADSRYVLYINGTRVGRGPVRSWPFALAYDEYDVAHLLRQGDNTIAVLVMHYGISTFQYIRGRGGLLLELNANERIIATDDSWKTTRHAGFDPRASRMSCQLAFTEVYDANAFDAAWTDPNFDDASWERAAIIGPAGMEPWTQLVPRDIPHLTEEPVYPSHVESLNAVLPAAQWTAALDLRNAFVPESADHANNVQFLGYIATVIRLQKASAFTIGVVDNGRLDWTAYVNGTLLARDRCYGEPPERYVTVELPEGEHFLLLDVSGTSHGHAFHIGFACDAPFELYAPGTAADAPFLVAGAFDSVEIIDHQPARNMASNHPDYQRLRTVSSVEEFLQAKDWVRPIPPQLVNPNDVFTLNLWKKDEIARPVPAELQQAIIPGSQGANIPLFEAMDTELIIDFGRELSGYLSFELDAAKGTIIDGYGFEYMDTESGWKQHTYQLDNTFRYVCREGRQRFTSYVRRGLRYLSLTVRGAARPPRLHDIKMLQSNYPVANVGSFRSSDPLLNDIWTISRDTTRLCMEDTFVDCPAYEQAYWVGDARNEALINYYTFGAREIVERCLRLVPGSAFQTPLFADQVPSGWNSVIPNWTFFWITACLEYYQYDGNPKFLEDQWPSVKLTLQSYLEHLNDQGLFAFQGWNLLDWAPFEQPRDGVVAPQNMFLVRSLRHGAEIGKAAGDAETADAFLRAADQLQEAINAALWSEERKAYVDCIHADGRWSSTTSMQTQVAAYLCDIPDKGKKELIEQYILQPPEDFVQIGSPFMSFFLYEAFIKLGRPEAMLENMRERYGLMIEHGATTCWEMYPNNGQFRDPRILTRSHCHAWSAGPAYFLGAHILGVRGTAPGWSRVTVAPKPCGLTWAKGSVPLPREGKIDVSWRVASGNKLHLRIKAPSSIEITAEAPEGYDMTVERIS